ncbi:hypothetical protein BJV74DRAFT_510401 [Russula compacta]|nr:hypothetical protein BJV74DRAFT_510401 [Russula compacta]
MVNARSEGARARTDTGLLFVSLFPLYHAIFPFGVERRVCCGGERGTTRSVGLDVRCACVFCRVFVCACWLSCGFDHFCGGPLFRWMEFLGFCTYVCGGKSSMAHKMSLRMNHLRELFNTFRMRSIPSLVLCIRGSRMVSQTRHRIPGSSSHFFEPR